MTAPTTTAAQEAFARLYVRTGNASTAYRATFKPERTVSRKAVWKRARTELDKPEVQAVIAALRAPAATTKPTAPPDAPSFIELLERMGPSSPASARGSILVDTFAAALNPGGTRWRK